MLQFVVEQLRPLRHALALRDVDDHCQRHLAAVRPKGAQPNLDRKFAAVLAQPIEISPRAHWSRRRLGKVGCAERRMLFAKTFWDKDFDWVAKQVFTPVAKFIREALVQQLNA